MKKIWIIILLELFNTSVFGQVNLVPNPSFEDTVHCPNTVDQIGRAVGWKTFSQTPDYFNSCADSLTMMNVPYTIGGYQYAATGNAFTGVICFATTFPNYREIIGCQLTSPLQIGSTYYLSFKVNMAFAGYFGNYLASNGMGAKLTTSMYSKSNPIAIDNLPTIYSDSIITDSVNWMSITGSFIADSAYEYLSLGNFFDAAHTDTMHLGPWVFRSYYYIDDVCLSPDSNYCYPLTSAINDAEKSNGINIYPNPFLSLITINSNETIKKVKVINALGQEILLDNLTDNSKKIQVDFQDKPYGIYYLTVYTDKKIFHKLIIHLNSKIK